MESSYKFAALLLTIMLFISSATPILGCASCTAKPKLGVSSITLPPITLPPIVTIPPITVTNPPSITLPPITLPPIVTIPPITATHSPPADNAYASPLPPPPPATTADTTCPIDTLKLGACVDLLGGLVHDVLGNPVANQCCPVLHGIMGIEAAICMCTTLKLKVLSFDMFVPLVLPMLVSCGIIPPPGFTCYL